MGRVGSLSALGIPSRIASIALVIAGLSYVFFAGHRLSNSSANRFDDEYRDMVSPPRQSCYDKAVFAVIVLLVTVGEEE